MLVSRARMNTLKSVLRQDMSFFDGDEHSPGAIASFLSTESVKLAGVSGCKNIRTLHLDTRLTLKFSNNGCYIAIHHHRRGLSNSWISVRLEVDSGLCTYHAPPVGDGFLPDVFAWPFGEEEKAKYGCCSICM
jgi:hypothetical protein